MAKQIKGNEIIEDNHLDNAVKSVRELSKGYEILSKNIKETAKLAKTGLGKANTNTAKGIREVNAEVNNSIKLRKADVDIGKKQEQLKREQLKTEKLLLNQKKKASAEQLKGNKEKQLSIKLEKAEAGSLNKLSLTVKKYEQELRRLNLTTAKGRKRQQELITKINQSNAVFKKNSSALSAQRINVGNYGSALNSVKGALTSMVNPATLALGAVFALGSAVKGAVELFSKFEQGNANLASVLGTSKEAISVLINDAKRLGSVTSFTASQITELQTELAKLGFSEKEILAATDAIQQLAAATGTELAEAAAVAGATLGGFGLEAEQTQRIADVMAKSFSTSALDMDKFKESMKSAAPAAKAVGISVEETTALLGTLANAGISGSKAGNNLKTTFINLNDAGLTLEEGLLKVSNSQDKLGTASALVGKNAAASFLVLADGVETTEKLKLGFENSGGAAQKMADTQLDTLTGSVTLMKSAYEGFILGLEDGNGVIAETIRNIVDATTVFLQLISGIKQTDESLRKLPFGDTIVRFKNLGKTWDNAFNSLEDFNKAALDTVFAMLSLVGVSDESIETFENLDNVWKDGFNSLEDFGNSAFTTLSSLGEAFASIFGFSELFNAQMFALQKTLNRVFDINLKLIKTTEKLNLEQRETARITRIASKNITNLEQSTGALIVAENQRIQSLIDGNLLQEDKNALISDLTEKYPELIKNYDLENLTQEQAVELQKQLRIEIAETTILKQKSLAITLLNSRVEEEQFKINQIRNETVRKQKQEELNFEKQRQLQRIDNIEQEVRNQLGLNTKIEELNDSATDNAIDNDGKRVSSFKSSSDEKIDHAEIEEQRLTDIRLKGLKEREKLRIQRLKDIRENDKDNDKARDKRDKEERERIAKNNKIQEDADKARLDKEKELAAERLQQQKDNFQALTDLLNSALEIQQSKIDSQIENSKNNIEESQTAVDTLQQQAILGNADAEASIKAEKQKIANEKENINALEKKKRDLQILITGLAFANEKIQNGDGNALANAGSEMANFISSLKGFYNGTETTLGADLGNAYAITGDRDTHIIKAHKDEHIIGVENSRKLGNMSQDDIVQGALMLKNGEFVGRRAINAVNQVDIFNDSRMISAMSEVKQAINNIQIPEHHFNYDAVNRMATETIILGNKRTNNHKKIGGIFS